MNYQNYLEVKDFKYEQYVEYLINKYGEVPGDYCSAGFSPNESIKRKQSDNLYIHHIREDKVAGLSDMKVAATAPFEYQQAHNLVYCNLLEHILLHIMIGEQNQGLGFGGAQFMIMQANDVYPEGNEVLEELKIRCENSIAAYSTQEEYITTLLNELTETLQISDRALCVLGTGLGKTKLGLEYLRKFGYKALVLCPDNTVKENWEKWGREETKPITYASFMRSYAKEDYSKYQILICDEAHRCTAPKWGEGVRYVLERGLLKVIGLTATPKEKKDKKNFETTAEFFNHKVCQGYTILDGIENGIIHDFSYIGAIYDTSGLREKYANIDDKTLLGELDLELNNTPTMDEILTRHMPKSKRKGIIFVSSIEAMDEAESIMKNLYPNMEYRRLHSHLPNRDIKEAKEWFELTEEGYLLTVNMVNEGAHYSGINTLIMFRRTQSSLLFNQQLGRIIVKTNKKDPEGIVFDLVNNANLIETEGDRFATSLRQAYKARKERGGKEKSNQIIIADYTEKISEVLKKITRIGQEKEVICIETDTKYKSIAEASRLTNIQIANISNVCRKQGRLTAGGFHWAFTDDNEQIQLLKKYKGQERAAKIAPGKYKPVICIETGEIFESCQAAEVAKGIGRGKVSCVCRKEQKTSGGLHWCFLSDEEGQKQCQKDIEEKIRQKTQIIIDFNKKIRNPRYKKVKCIETNIIYDTAAEAMRQTGINNTSIGWACSGKRKTAGGYHWEYIDEE